MRDRLVSSFSSPSVAQSDRATRALRRSSFSFFSFQLGSTTVLHWCSRIELKRKKKKKMMMKTRKDGNDDERWPSFEAEGKEEEKGGKMGTRRGGRCMSRFQFFCSFVTKKHNRNSRSSNNSKTDTWFSIYQKKFIFAI